MDHLACLPPAPLGVTEHARVTLTPARFDPHAPTQTRLGAYDDDGLFIEGFRMLRASEASPLETLAAEPDETLQGTWIYGGVLRPHYGHFLLESLSRAWFLRQRPDLPILWHAAHGKSVLSPWHREVFALLGIPEGRLHIVLHPTRVARVLLPDPGCVIERYLHPLQAKALGVFPAGCPIPGRRVWLSRTRLPEGLARVEGEVALEAELASAGWTILHPQTLPVWRQLAAMAGVEEIAGFEGSAFHSLLLLEQPLSRITLIRRSEETFPASHRMITDALQLQQRVLEPRLRPDAGEGRRRAVVLEDPSAVACAVLDAGSLALAETREAPASAPAAMPGLVCAAPAQGRTRLPEPARGLAFVHVPKTAGTAFTRALGAAWPRVRVVGTAAAFDAIPPAEFDTLDLVAGHFYAFQLEQRRLRDFTPITVLRDPFERLFSAYRFGRQFALRGVAVGPAMRMAGEMSFGAWAFAPGSAAHRHAQLFQLGLSPGDKAASVPLATLLERATARLDSMLVGTVDALEAFLGLAFSWHGHSEPPPLSEAMVTTDRYTPEDAGLTRAERETLLEALRPDFALLAHARALMLRRLDAGSKPPEA